MLVAVALLAYLSCNDGLYYDFVNGVCLTAQQCNGNGSYAYRNTKLCAKEFIPAEDDQYAPTYEGEEPYECEENWYLALQGEETSGSATCVEDCADMFVAEDQRVCVQASGNCYRYIRLYASDVNGVKLCIS